MNYITIQSIEGESLCETVLQSLHKKCRKISIPIDIGGVPGTELAPEAAKIFLLLLIFFTLTEFVGLEFP